MYLNKVGEEGREKKGRVVARREAEEGKGSLRAGREENIFEFEQVWKMLVT